MTKPLRALFYLAVFLSAFAVVAYVGFSLDRYKWNVYYGEKKQEQPAQKEKVYIFLKQGCKAKDLSKDESELWGTFARDEKWVFLAPQICEGTYSLMSSEGLGTVGTVSFVDGGIIVELATIRIGIK